MRCANRTPHGCYASRYSRLTYNQDIMANKKPQDDGLLKTLQDSNLQPPFMGARKPRHVCGVIFWTLRVQSLEAYMSKGLSKNEMLSSLWRYMGEDWGDCLCRFSTSVIWGWRPAQQPDQPSKQKAAGESTPTDRAGFEPATSSTMPESITSVCGLVCTPCGSQCIGKMTSMPGIDACRNVVSDGWGRVVSASSVSSI